MSTYKFARIKKSTLSEEVEHAIRDLVLTGRLQPGEKLPTERELAEQFGVSIVTIRGALRALEALGMINKKRGKNGGTIVSPSRYDPLRNALSESLANKRINLSDITQMRSLVEPECARIATSKITDESLGKIYENIQACESILVNKSGELSEHGFYTIEQHNVEFHKLIAQATGNPLLFVTIGYIVETMMSLKRKMVKPNQRLTERSVAEHKEIYELLKNRRELDVKQKIEMHIAWATKYLTHSESKYG